MKPRKSINTEEAMPTVIVLITLPTNIVIIFVRIILMWNNNDEDYDHVNAGNQERAELGKEVFNTDTIGSHFCRLIAIFLFVSSIELFQLSTLGLSNFGKSPSLNMNLLSLQNFGCKKNESSFRRTQLKLIMSWLEDRFLRCTHEFYSP